MAEALHCSETERLQRWLLGQVAGPEAAALEEHVERCAACRQALPDLESDDPLLATAREDCPGEAPAAVVDALVGLTLSGGGKLIGNAGTSAVNGVAAFSS